MQNILIENIFPTPVFSTIIENIDEVQTELDAAFTNLKFSEPPSNWGKTLKLSSKDYGSDIVSNLNLVATSNMIAKNVNDYCHEIDFPWSPFTMESWFTSCKNNDYAHIHTHGNADISGVYYYKATGDEGDLFFETPNLACKSSLCFNKKYAERWNHKPSTGKLLLFPGWLPHGVMTNTTNSERNSLSFNIHFSRNNND